MAFHERKYANLVLRLTGLVLFGFGALIARHLFGAADPTAKSRALPYLLALIGMASTSAGSALAVLGRHLFDQVDLSSRWTIHAYEREARSRSARLRGRDAQ